MYLLPTGRKAREFTIRLIYPATAIGCSGTVNPITSDVPSAPSGIYNAPLPSTISMIPPPKVLIRRTSNGKAGNNDGSVTIVSLDPTTIASNEATIPASGPATAKSNMAAIFFGGELNVVTLLVIPVTIDGTNVGTLVLIWKGEDTRKTAISEYGRQVTQLL